MVRQWTALRASEEEQENYTASLDTRYSSESIEGGTMGILDRFSMRRQEAAAAPPDAEEGAGIAGLAEALETIKARGALVRWA
ncbi:protein of unknown function [Methanoculleus bourgensis]|uniref:Uncharacterized protein n=2 Tax=Methanoculleus bourgensis TaxID=83986 RepID=A0A0X3BLA9_9EURY|nr:protein of unknown function [Methanoculleus bourgensis]